MNTADLLREYKRAWKGIKAPSKPQAPIRVPPTRRHHGDKSPTQRQQVLDMAASLYQPGEAASPSVIADAMGVSRFSISAVIAYHRRNGQWPYAGIGTGKGNRWLHRDRPTARKENGDA